MAFPAAICEPAAEHFWALQSACLPKALSARSEWLLLKSEIFPFVFAAELIQRNARNNKTPKASEEISRCATQAAWPFIVFIYMMCSATAESMESLSVSLLCKLTKPFLLCVISLESLPHSPHLFAEQGV